MANAMFVQQGFSITGMNLTMILGGGTVVLLAGMAWLMTRIEYRVGSKELKVLLFGVPLRRIPYGEIVYASKRAPDGLAEKWYNTFKTSHRLLTIERRTGLRKYLCITPRNRYEFLADLKRAVLRVDPNAEWAVAKQFQDSTELFRRGSERAADG